MVMKPIGIVEHLQIYKDCKAMMQAEGAQSDGA